MGLTRLDSDGKTTINDTLTVAKTSIEYKEDYLINRFNLNTRSESIITIDWFMIYYGWIVKSYKQALILWLNRVYVLIVYLL